MTNKKPLRRLAMLLSALMLASMTACAKPAASSTAPTESKTSSTEEKAYYNKTGYPICETPIALSVACQYAAGASKSYQVSGKADKSNIDQLEYYYRKLGLDITCDLYLSDDWSNQFTMMLTSDSVPDMIWDVSQTLATVNKYGEQKYFANLNEYQDIMPNLQAFFEKYPELKAFCDDNGAMYATATINGKDYINCGYRFFMNRTFMDNLKAEVPTTLDDFYKLLVRFRDEDANGNGDPNDEVPFDYSSYVRLYTDNMLFTAFGIHSSNPDMPLHTDKDGKVTMLDDNYKAYLKFLTQLYDEGLMDKNAFSLTSDEARAQVKDNRLGAYPAYAPYVTTGSTQDTDCEVAVGMVSLASQYTDNKNQFVLASPIVDNVKFVISEKSQYKEACARLLDFLYTEEGNYSTRYGELGNQVKGAHDDLLDADLVDLDKDKLPAEFTSVEEWRNSKVVMNTTLQMCTALVPNAKYTDKGHARIDAVKKYENDPEKMAELLKTGWGVLIAKNIVDTNAEFVDAYPTLSYGSDVADKRAQYCTDVKNSLLDGKSTTIIGGLANFDANWDKLVKAVEGAGMNELLKIEQTAYDAYMANMK